MALGESLESKLIALTNQLWAGIILKKLRNTIPRKVLIDMKISYMLQKRYISDHSHGFGGKFGVQTDRVDKSAVGWDHIEKLEKHDSQTDHKKGFGGVFGVEKDRMDKSAVGFEDHSKVGTNYIKTKPDISGAKPSNLRAKFENLALHSEDEAKAKAGEQKRMREDKDRIDRDQAAKDFVSFQINCA